uniref:Uncharacterized protein n=1 Tax=Panagrolaimus davidi TaxID=227884 RepID=A0A914PS35_9BILA
MVLSKKIISIPIKTQYFPFLSNFMKHILQNSSPKLLLKLYQFCKYFYFKSRITIAPDVWYNPEKEEIKVFVNNGKDYYNHDYRNGGKLWLCEKLQINSGVYGYGLIGNVFLNKIYRNTLKKLVIYSGFTLFEELEILSKSPFLTEVILQTTVKNENDEPISIEEIMVLFPNMKKFEICPTHFTLKSFQKLLTFKFLNKMNCLKFWMVRTEFDPISMCKFLKGIFDENAKFTLDFDYRLPELKQQLLPRVKEIIGGWKTNKPKYVYFGF